MNYASPDFLILIIFGFFAIIQLIYYVFIFLRFALNNTNLETSEPVPVSIVICAKNESENLEKYLPVILEQQYANYEVIVVNDCSEDETENVLKRFCNIYPHLRSTFIKEDQKFSHGKKLALTVGIKSAKNDWVLLTDADCCPQGKMWLANMARHFTQNTSIVLGYGGYYLKKNFLNMLIRYDTSFIALLYFSFALIGKPYMGVGRNLAYRKSLFFANKGFASHVRLDSGDDDLFVNEVANSDNVMIEYSVEAHTRTEPKNTFKKWIDQKARHFTTFSLYKKSDKYLLGTESFSRVFFYLFFICLLILEKYWIIAAGTFVFRLIFQLIVFKIAFKRLNERNLFIISPLYDFFLPFIYMGIYLSNLFRPRRPWR
jgi:poly-beta-1,6-N-acetyl-D-glucosamine synthase